MGPRKAAVAASGASAAAARKLPPGSSAAAVNVDASRSRTRTARSQPLRTADRGGSEDGDEVPRAARGREALGRGGRALPGGTRRPLRLPAPAAGSGRGQGSSREALCRRAPPAPAPPQPKPSEETSSRKSSANSRSPNRSQYTSGSDAGRSDDGGRGDGGSDDGGSDSGAENKIVLSDGYSGSRAESASDSDCDDSGNDGDSSVAARSCGEPAGEERQTVYAGRRPKQGAAKAAGAVPAKPSLRTRSARRGQTQDGSRRSGRGAATSRLALRQSLIARLERARGRSADAGREKDACVPRPPRPPRWSPSEKVKMCDASRKNGGDPPPETADTAAGSAVLEQENAAPPLRAFAGSGEDSDAEGRSPTTAAVGGADDTAGGEDDAPDAAAAGSGRSVTSLSEDALQLFLKTTEEELHDAREKLRALEQHHLAACCRAVDREENLLANEVMRALWELLPPGFRPGGNAEAITAADCDDAVLALRALVTSAKSNALAVSRQNPATHYLKKRKTLMPDDVAAAQVAAAAGSAALPAVGGAWATSPNLLMFETARPAPSAAPTAVVGGARISAASPVGAGLGGPLASAQAAFMIEQDAQRAKFMQAYIK